MRDEFGRLKVDRCDIVNDVLINYAKSLFGVEHCYLIGGDRGFLIRLIGRGKWGEFTIYYHQLDNATDPMDICVKAIDTIYTTNFNNGPE